MMTTRTTPSGDRNYSDISTLHNASRRTVSYGETSRQYGKDPAMKRVSPSTNGHLETSSRETWAKTSTRQSRDGTEYNSSSAVRQCEQYQEMLSERMAQAERTAKAMRNAKQTINAETLLAQAKIEAEAWKNDKSKLASFKSAQHLSPLGVRTVIAERDELKYQLRKASAELGKVEN